MQGDYDELGKRFTGVDREAFACDDYSKPKSASHHLQHVAMPPWLLLREISLSKRTSRSLEIQKKRCGREIRAEADIDQT